MSKMQKYLLAPYYQDDFCRSIGVLQQLQALVGNDATLGDVAQIVHCFQQEFGAQEQLESVIQFLVCRSLEKQVVQRTSRSRR